MKKSQLILFLSVIFIGPSFLEASKNVEYCKSCCETGHLACHEPCNKKENRSEEWILCTSACDTGYVKCRETCANY